MNSKRPRRAENRMLTLLACALILPLSAPTSARPQNGCPNEQASEVEAKVSEAGTVQKCGTGLMVFGATIGIGGERCPSQRFTYPAHQVCEHAELVGSSCEPDGNLPVTKELCRCDRLTIPFLEIGLSGPTCSCSDPLDAGHIEDSKTQLCVNGPSPEDPVE